MKILSSIFRMNRPANAGEIATTLTLVSLLFMLAGTLVGVKTTQDIRNKAAESCPYSATAKVIRADGKPLDGSVDIYGQSHRLAVVADKLLDQATNSLGQKGEFTYSTSNHVFAPYKKDDDAFVSLARLETKNWQVKSVFCKQRNGSKVGCDRNPTLVKSTPFEQKMGPFHLACGVDIEYGWIIEPVSTNPALPPVGGVTGTLKTLPTAAQGRIGISENLTPTVATNRISPTPTTSIYRGYLCNARCNPNGGVGQTTFGQSELPSTCANGYTCVNTCAQGELGCSPSNRGVCRAIECINDVSCGCVRPIPTSSTGKTPTPYLTTYPTPTTKPLALPCFYDSKVSVIDTSGRSITSASLGSQKGQWTLVNDAKQAVQFDSHYGSMSPLQWGDGQIKPNKKSDGLMQSSAFIPLYTPDPSKKTTSLTLTHDNSYEVVQKRMITHCQREFDQLNGTIRGCSSVNSNGELLGNYTGVVTAGAAGEIPGVALLCNMHVEAQYTVRKKPTGIARVSVQLSSGADAAKNVPFTSEQVNPGTQLYAGQSTVTFTGISAGNQGITKTVVINQPTVDVQLQVGSYSVAYNFPQGVLPVKEGNDGYRLNSPPIDGNQITVTESNVYTYRIMYNMNTYYCKGTRNKTSCEACGGGKVDEITNGAWPNPNGKVLCCPTTKGGKTPADFKCADNFDSRCTAGDVYYGNCGHRDPASGVTCPQGQRAKYVCTADRYWGYQGCVNSPSNMALCTAPTATPAPRPTNGGLRPSVTPTPIVDECERVGVFSGRSQTTQSENPPKECPNTFIGGTIHIVNPHNLPLNNAQIAVVFGETDKLTSSYQQVRTLRGLKDGVNQFRFLRDDKNALLKANTEYTILATTLNYTYLGKPYHKENKHTIQSEKSFLPYNGINHILDLSDYTGGRNYLGGTLNIYNPKNAPLDGAKIKLLFKKDKNLPYAVSATLRDMKVGPNRFIIFEDDQGNPIANDRYYPQAILYNFDNYAYSKEAHDRAHENVIAPFDGLEYNLDLSDFNVGYFKGIYNIKYDASEIKVDLKGTTIYLAYKDDFGGKTYRTALLSTNEGVELGDTKFTITQDSQRNLIQPYKNYIIDFAQINFKNGDYVVSKSHRGERISGITNGLKFDFDINLLTISNPHGASGVDQEKVPFLQRLKQNILNGWELVINAFK